MIENGQIPTRSPLSPMVPRKIRDLPKAFLLEQLDQYYQSIPPADVVETDYALWECTETGLQFSWPNAPGNTKFYQWISSFSSYYPGFRWEYGQVAAQVKNAGLTRTPLKVLDVGCGKGDFLKILNFLPAGDRYALDLNEPAIQACQTEGFNGFCGTVESALAAGFVQLGGFNVVTSFHCLEHVADPVDFARQLLRLTAPGGKLFLSTPYSPMSFEQDWFDVMNHPPHHMTRWNLRSYQKLAEILGVQMRHHVPATHPLKQALQTFRLIHYGPHRQTSRGGQLGDLLLHAPQFLTLWRRLGSRAGRHEAGGSDLILVELIAS